MWLLVPKAGLWKSVALMNMVRKIFSSKTFSLQGQSYSSYSSLYSSRSITYSSYLSLHGGGLGGHFGRERQ